MLFLMFNVVFFELMEAFMAYPKHHILKGPAQRDLEMAFISRNLGARARFTVFVTGHNQEVEIALRILNFSFVTCQGPNYNLAGDGPEISSAQRLILPPFNFIFVTYNTEQRGGLMEFTNGE